MAGPISAAIGAASTRPEVTTTSSGVPLVNITTPNAAGISHNRYDRFDVDPIGVVLNNSRVTATNALGVQIDANANLSGRSASLILNEVVTAIPSQLNGPIAIFGDRAAIVIANPNGVTCNGCGFINTSHVTLTTGTPQFLASPGGSATAFDTAAALAFTVAGGQVVVSGAGLSSPLDRLDLIAQTLMLDGQVSLGSGALNLIAGRNTVDGASLAILAQGSANTQAGIGAQLAIDASLLGAMNAGVVRMVATSAGMGVKVASNLAASSGDLRITSNGDLILKRADAARDIVLAAADTLTHAGMSAGRDVAVSAGVLDNSNQQIVAQGAATLIAPVFNNRSGRVQAGTELLVRSPGGVFDLSAGELLAGASLRLYADVLTNTGRFTPSGPTTLVADSSLINSGVLLSGSTLTLETGIAGLILNTGTLGALGDLAIHSSALGNTGSLQSGANSTIDVSGNLYNDGTLTTTGLLSLNAGNLSNASNGLLIASAGSQFAIAGEFANDGTAGGSGSLSITAGSFRQAGTLETLGNLDLAVAGAANNLGSITSHADLRFRSGSFSNSGRIQAANDAYFNFGAGGSNAGGNLLAGRDLSLFTQQSSALGGTVAANRDLVLNFGSYTHNPSETVFLAGQDLTVNAADFVNKDILEAWRDLHLSVSGTLTNSGLLLAGRDITAAADVLKNTAGSIEATRDLSVSAGSVLNQSAFTSTVTVDYSMDDYRARVLASTDDEVVQGKLFNEITPDWQWHNSRFYLINRYRYFRDSDLRNPTFTLTVSSHGAKATMSAGRDLTAQVSGSFTNDAGLVSAVQDVAITANSFSNAASQNDVFYANVFAGGGGHKLQANVYTPTVVKAGNSVTVTAPTQVNSGTIASNTVTLAGSHLTNGLTDYHYQTPPQTLPHSDIALTVGQLGLPNLATPAALPPGVSFTPTGGSLFSSASRLALLTPLPAGSINSLLPAELRNTQTSFLLDAYLEREALRQAAFAEAGKASFLASGDVDAERAQLLDAAARFASAQGIHLGVALSDAQRRALTEPILWYVEQSFTGPDGNRYTALVPRVYLPESSRQELATSSVGTIEAGQATLTFASDIRNTGSIQANNLSITTERLVNEKRSAEWGRYTTDIKGGYLEVWGDRVQPGGFVGAAALTLNANRVDSISGEFFEGGHDASAKLQALLGSNFSQSLNDDHTHTKAHVSNNGGLKQVAIMVVAMVAAYFTAGAASGMIASSAAQSAGISVQALASSGSAWAVGGAANAAATGALASMAGSATSQILSTGRINGGQLFKSGVTGALTAGLLNAKVFDTAKGAQSLNQIAGVQDVSGTGAKLANFNFDNFGANLGGMAARGVVNAGVNRLVYGEQAGSFGNAFRNSFVGDLAAVGANAVGGLKDIDPTTRALAHAGVGALAAKATGRDAVAGAIGAAGASLLNPVIDKAIGGEDGSGWGSDTKSAQQNQSVTLQAASMLAAGAFSQAAGHDAVTAANAAQNETLNNYLSLKQIQDKEKKLNEADTDEKRLQIKKDYAEIDKRQQKEAEDCLLGGGNCASVMIDSKMLKEVLTELSASCSPPRACSADARSSINQINSLLGKADAIATAYPLESIAALLATGGLGTVVGAAERLSWNPLTGPGPLGAKIASTFRSSTYTEAVTSEATTLYRVYGGSAGELGAYWTRTAPTGPVQSIIDSALNPAWGNNALNVARINVPVGTRIFEGIAAPQGGLVGGGNQIFIQNVNPAWIIK
ncbi:two-partner secretion domain-containing protein [Rhodocyclus tenuis]|uniref:Filamentous hemagglutinin n=1 Tax=Rhodocyclus tenuis TaxID=1066 RepID=A0A840GK20_RHOTE|nr:filamentous hemagglutinin N-terminal domain-containing protein [Rhodocyclus tenuis]MBB4248782.1 filamentous hemagglutinin [Rhodocyclus tenuis]